MTKKSKTDLELRAEDYVLAREAREFLGLTPMQFSRLISTGELAPPYQQTERRCWFPRDGLERIKSRIAFDAEWLAGYTVSADAFAERLGWRAAEVRRSFRAKAKVIGHKLRWSESFVTQTLAEWKDTPFKIPSRHVRAAILKVDPRHVGLYARLTREDSGGSFPRLLYRRRGKELYFMKDALLKAAKHAREFRPIDHLEFRKLLNPESEPLTHKQLQLLEGIGYRNGLLFPQRIDGRSLRNARGPHWYFGEAKYFADRFFVRAKEYLGPDFLSEYIGYTWDTEEPLPRDTVTDRLGDRYLTRFAKE